MFNKRRCELNIFGRKTVRFLPKFDALIYGLDIPAESP